MRTGEMAKRTRCERTKVFGRPGAGCSGGLGPFLSVHKLGPRSCEAVDELHAAGRAGEMLVSAPRIHLAELAG